MTRSRSSVVELASHLLVPDEREAVLGDFAESGETGGRALRDILGLIVRRQAELWRDWRPWLVLASLVVPLAWLLSIAASLTANTSAVYAWSYLNNWDWGLLRSDTFWYVLWDAAGAVIAQYTILICWSWSAGFLLGSVSQRVLPVEGLLFCLVSLIGVVLGASPYLASWFQSVTFSPPPSYPDPVSALLFYREMFPVIVLTVLVMVPVVWATRQSAGLKRLPKPVRITLLIAAALTVIGMAMRQPGLGFFLKAHKQLAILHGWPRQLLHVVVYWPIGYLMVIAIGKRWRNRLLRPSALLLLLAGVTIAADSSGLPAVLQPENERKAAPELLLEDSSGKTMKWEQYRGKVVLLDFWATWCTGCKKEIPWFSEFQKIYGAKGFAVVGVSMDDGGWKVVKPFLAENHVPYRMLLGNDSSTEQYGIATLPDSFLIDRQGRVAASYRGAIVDKDNVEANIKALISERQ